MATIEQWREKYRYTTDPLVWSLVGYALIEYYKKIPFLDDKMDLCKVDLDGVMCPELFFMVFTALPILLIITKRDTKAGDGHNDKPDP